MFITTANAGRKTSRFEDLKAALQRRRQGLAQAVQDKIRDVRSDGIAERDVFDTAERSDVDTQDDMELALIQLKAEALGQVDAALRRIDEGTYGDCSECGAEIANARLRALPFASRCRDCEEVREVREQRQRSLLRRGSPVTLDL